MVKGISKQVIVVNSPDKGMFDQAIFILSDDAMKGNGVTNDELLREAKNLINHKNNHKNSSPLLSLLLLFSGAFITGVVWLLTCVL